MTAKAYDNFRIRKRFTNGITRIIIKQPKILFYIHQLSCFWEEKDSVDFDVHLG
jgi:G:T-mismatch repair DNA endonuclease (very short patch repair protein)